MKLLLNLFIFLNTLMRYVTETEINHPAINIFHVCMINICVF